MEQDTFDNIKKERQKGKDETLEISSTGYGYESSTDKTNEITYNDKTTNNQ